MDSTKQNVGKIVITALFAALACVATMIIKVPTVGTNGYVNIGDTIVLLSAWMIGGVYGALAAGIGSALSDFISGYGSYVPGTFVIKFLMALVAYLVFVAIKKANTKDSKGMNVVAYIVSGVVAEVIMVLGYFLYESTLLGYGLGAAIGAKTANPDKVVINVAGDGCFRMNMNEIATATRNNMPLIQVVINNHVLGMVRQWQTLFYDHRYSNTVLNDKVDFVKLAEAMGAVGIRVTKKEELADAIKKAIELNTTVVLDCIIDSDDKVFPMVPAGANIEDAFDEDDLRAKKK